MNGPGLTAPPAPWIAPDAPAAEHSESSAIPEPKHEYDDEYDHTGPDDSDAEHSESSAISEYDHEDQDEPPLKQRRLS